MFYKLKLYKRRLSVTDKLKRVRQCEKCPWKVSTDPNTIPDGYTPERHRNLSGTVAKPRDVRGVFGGKLRIFACHESPVGDEVHCVGWLMNQLGPGNNIALRIDMMRCENLKHVQLDGPQHEIFEDTLPDNVLQTEAAE
jgi:hypothetical protein